MSARGGDPFGARLVAGDIGRLHGQLAAGSFDGGHATSLGARTLGLTV
jgi:hypothetical protein